MKKVMLGFASLMLMLSIFACSKQSSAVSYEENVEKALEQADLKGVTVSEDKDKNTITLGGKLHSEDAKNQAGQVAQSVAGTRIIANEISIEPVGVESEAKKIASNMDDAIESNYKAVLIAKGLDKEDIHYDVKNGVLTLKGEVHTMRQRDQAQEVATSVPNVAQVINQIQLER